MRMEFVRKLPMPVDVKNMYPLKASVKETVTSNTEELKKIFDGRSDRIALIIGPCSADNEESVLDYISRLVPVQEQVKEKIMIVPRIYTNKPRTTGQGYKGIVHQPDPANDPDLFKGIIRTREMHIRAVSELGFVCADELLYPENYKYLDDLLGYVAIGARSVEDQQHRMTASATDCPVGMKNPTSGDLSVMMNAITAAQSEHDFIYRGWEGHSLGNPYAHSILRGYVNRQGVIHSNYNFETLRYLIKLYEDSGLKNPGVIIDCNHSNSGKDPFQQPRIIDEVMLSCKHDEGIKDIVKGFMVESYIEDGNQPVDGGVFGKSITDACIGWDKSVRLIYGIAERL